MSPQLRLQLKRSGPTSRYTYVLLLDALEFDECQALSEIVPCTGSMECNSRRSRRLLILHEREIIPVSEPSWRLCRGAAGAPSGSDVRLKTDASYLLKHCESRLATAEVCIAKEIQVIEVMVQVVNSLLKRPGRRLGSTGSIGRVEFRGESAEHLSHRQIDFCVPIICRRIDQPNTTVLAAQHVAIPKIAVYQAWNYGFAVEKFLNPHRLLLQTL